MKFFNRARSYTESFFWLISTFLLAPFFYLLIFLRKNEERQLKILVIQTAKIGDLVCTTPIFRAIKEKYPQVFLFLLATSKTKGMVEANHFIDEIILIDQDRFRGIGGRLRLIKEIRRKHFFWSINVLPGIFLNIISFWAFVPNRILTTSKYLGETVRLLSIFSNYRLEYPRHTLSTAHYLNLLRFLDVNEARKYQREIFIEKIAEEKADRFLKENNLSLNDLLIGICLTAGNKIKQWPQDKFAELVKRLITELKAKIIFIGGPQDKEIINFVNHKIADLGLDSSNYFSLQELPALLKRLKLLISVDSGPLYIASAVGTPVVDIAGPIDIYEQPPLGEKCLIIQKDLPCIPCSFMIPPARRCQMGDRRCLKQISAEEVFKEVKKFLNQLYGH
jgi:lipopolysaccharide heptosyltransferase II